MDETSTLLSHSSTFRARCRRPDHRISCRQSVAIPPGPGGPCHVEACSRTSATNQATVMILKVPLRHDAMQLMPCFLGLEGPMTTQIPRPRDTKVKLCMRGLSWAALTDSANLLAGPVFLSVANSLAFASSYSSDCSILSILLQSTRLVSAYSSWPSEPCPRIMRPWRGTWMWKPRGPLGGDLPR